MTDIRYLDGKFRFDVHPECGDFWIYKQWVYHCNGSKIGRMTHSNYLQNFAHVFYITKWTAGDLQMHEMFEWHGSVYQCLTNGDIEDKSGYCSMWD